MDLAQKLQSLARRIPGVAGYQDQESSRDTDKRVRLQLAEQLEQAGRAIENRKRELAQSRQLTELPRLERISSKLARLANSIRFASRGYHGFFDAQKIDAATLERLYAFDLELFDDVDLVRKHADSSDHDALETAIDQLDAAFARRADILQGK